MKNLHALEIKFYPATNNSGARVGIISKRFGQRVTIDFNYEYNTTTEIAINYLTEKGFNIVAQSEFGDTDILLSDTFQPLR